MTRKAAANYESYSGPALTALLLPASLLSAPLPMNFGGTVYSLLKKANRPLENPEVDLRSYFAGRE